ncbi:hypothetical protein HDU81_005617 [Chytriomyces hyalinus]|nr:hypothetical protein HDU81_005617 [Chytriomyces hyalinus]
MSTNRPSRVSHTSTTEATNTSTSKIQTQAQLLAVAAAKKKAESVLAKRAIQLFDYIAASDKRDAEKRRAELSEHYKKQYELLNIATADLEKRRQDALDYEQQCKRDLIARRKRALTAIHSPSVKVHLVPCKDAGTSNDPIGKRVASAAAISSSKAAARHSKARAKSGGCLSSLSETATLLQPALTAGIPHSASGNRVGESLVQIISSSVPEEGAMDSVQPLLQSPPIIDSNKYLPRPSFAQTSFEARKASTASSIHAGRPSMHLSKSARPSTTSLSFLSTITAPPSKREPMFRGSAYRKQVQTLAEQRTEFTRTIVPVSKRYDPRAHAQHDASSAAPPRRQACSAYASYGGRMATRRGDNSESERGMTAQATARTIAALKLKYEQQTSDEKVEAEPVSIDAVQNSVFQRLSQKKHMLVMAVKNRKRASKLKIATPLDRSSLGTPPPQRRMSSAHPVEASTDTFAAESSSADLEDFFEEDEEEDAVGVKSEKGTVPVVDDEEHWRDPKIVALLGIVNERVGDSRRGRAILAERPKTVDAAYSRRGVDVRTVEQPPQSFSSAQAVNRAVPEGSGQANSRQTSASDEGSPEVVTGSTLPSSAPASKSILRENRGASAGWRVTFEMSKSAPEPSNTNSAEHSSRDSDQAETQLPLPQPSFTREAANMGNGCKQMGTNRKWQPLGLRALDDFRKTLLPSTMTRPAKINDIAVAVEERVSLPNIMRVWVTPDIKD